MQQKFRQRTKATLYGGVIKSSSVASPICREGQSEKKLPDFCRPS